VNAHISINFVWETKGFKFYDMQCCYVICSACSGLVSASLGTPADVVKTRMMNQRYVNGRWPNTYVLINLLVERRLVILVGTLSGFNICMASCFHVDPKFNHLLVNI